MCRTNAPYTVGHGQRYQSSRCLLFDFNVLLHSLPCRVVHFAGDCCTVSEVMKISFVFSLSHNLSIQYIIIYIYICIRTSINGKNNHFWNVHGKKLFVLIGFIFVSFASRTLVSTNTF